MLLKCTFQVLIFHYMMTSSSCRNNLYMSTVLFHAIDCCTMGNCANPLNLLVSCRLCDLAADKKGILTGYWVPISLYFLSLSILSLALSLPLSLSCHRIAINIWETPAVASQPPQTSPTSWVSQDTDEETDMSHTPWHPASHFFSSFSDNEQHTEGTHEHPLIQQSYARLAQAPVVYSNGLGKEDKWHTWFKTQREWMDNLDKEDYFDDGL